MQQQIYKVLSRKHGLKISPPALKYLCGIFESNVDQATLDECLDFIANEFLLQGSSFMIDQEALELVVARISQKAAAAKPTFLSVIDSMDVPRYRYNPVDKEFILYFLLNSREPAKAFIADASANADSFRERYELLKQRVLRHESFSPCSFNSRNFHTVLDFKLDHTDYSAQRQKVGFFSFVWHVDPNY
jgi:hypothetical protein